MQNQRAQHDLQTPLGADQLRHQVPQPRQLLVLLRTMRQRDLDETEGEAMSAITPVDGYVATDGKFFMNANEARAYQHSLDLEQEIKEFLGEVCQYSLSGYAERAAITRWEEYKKLKELEKT
jgi:hypothetical protein